MIVISKKDNGLLCGLSMGNIKTTLTYIETLALEMQIFVNVILNRMCGNVRGLL